MDYYSREMHINNKNDVIEIILVLSFYCFVALSSIKDLGFLAAPGFLFLLALCALKSPRTGFLVLVAMFYLPMGGVKLPLVFIIATLIVGGINLIKLKGRNWWAVNKNIIILYSFFLLFRFVSILFVNNKDSFNSYFFVSFSVLIHIIVVSYLIKNDSDIPFILRMWGGIGALAGILGYLHFMLQDSSYLRQIYISTGDYDKSTIDGSFDFVRWIWAGAEPNFHGLILLIPFVINLHYLTKKLNILNVILAVVSFFGILGTFSRTSFLVACVVCLLFVFLPQEKRKLFSVKRILVSLLLITAVSIIVVAYFPDFIDRLETIQEAASSNEASGRLPLYREAINNFLSNPIFGIGTGQTALVSKYHLESHNLFLQTLGENGIINFLILIALFWGYIRKALVLRYKTRLYIIAGIAVILNANTVSYFDMRLFFSLYVLLNFGYMWRNSVNQSVVL